MKNIMFNDSLGLTQAVIDEIKDLTRRAVLQKHIDAYEAHKEWCVNPCTLQSYLLGKGLNKYKVGEIVAVAQNYKTVIGQKIPISGVSVVDALKMVDKEYAGWGNKMFVKPICMPHQIKILSVRVEKLQDISDEDILREGIVQIHELDSFYFECKERDEGFYFDTPKEAFASLIDKVGKKGDWSKNPYVWVYEFKLLKTK